MICPDCKSDKVNVQMIVEKRRWSGGWALGLALLCLTILGVILFVVYSIYDSEMGTGIIIAFALLVMLVNVFYTSGERRKTYAICQDCGNATELISTNTTDENPMSIPTEESH